MEKYQTPDRSFICSTRRIWSLAGFLEIYQQILKRLLSNYSLCGDVASLQFPLTGSEYCNRKYWSERSNSHWSFSYSQSDIVNPYLQYLQCHETVQQNESNMRRGNKSILPAVSYWSGKKTLFICFPPEPCASSHSCNR